VHHPHHRPEGAGFLHRVCALSSGGTNFAIREQSSNVDGEAGEFLAVAKIADEQLSSGHDTEGEKSSTLALYNRATVGLAADLPSLIRQGQHSGKSQVAKAHQEGPAKPHSLTNNRSAIRVSGNQSMTEQQTAAIAYSKYASV
jgi:hypothetical protein